MGHRPDPAGGATVVISLRVRPEHEQDYARWQARIDAAAEAFAGFEGSEVLRPREGIQDDWVVVYRFDTVDNLVRWLRSDVRAELLDEAAPHFERVSERVVATPHEPSRPVTVVVSQHVKPDHEAEFVTWQRGITNAAGSFPGFLGGETFRPVPGVQDEWIVVFRFASPQTLQAWLDSPLRRAWLEKSKPWVEDVAIQTVGGGLGGWFPVSASAPTRPPDWKQAVAVLVALYPTVMLLSRHLAPPLAKIVSAPVNMFLNNVASVALLTWIVMPVTTRILGPWLNPKDTRATAVGSALLTLVCGAMVALFVATE